MLHFMVELMVLLLFMLLFYMYFITNEATFTTIMQILARKFWCLNFRAKIEAKDSHYAKSQIFVHKFNFDKTLQFSREIKVVNN